MKIYLVSAIWSLCEATFFFVVPDIWLTMIAKDNLRKALIASLYSLFAALIGGSIWYFISVHFGEEYAFVMMDKMPKTNLEQVKEAQQNLEASGFWAMMTSPWVGTPYKLYSVTANSMDIEYWKFMLYSIPSRLTRFIILVLVTHFTIKFLEFLGLKIHRLIFVLFGWIIFYAYI